MPRDYTDISGKKNNNYKTGYAIRKNGKRLSFYNTWQNMKARCLNPKNPKYKNYGGRGIKICNEWLNIKGFSEWALNNNWQDGYSLDRIDNDGDYCPENCKWIPISENSRKKRTTKLSFEQAKEIRKRVLSGEKEKDLAKEYNVVHGTIWFIVNNFTHVPNGECVKKIKERSKK